MNRKKGKVQKGKENAVAMAQAKMILDYILERDGRDTNASWKIEMILSSLDQKQFDIFETYRVQLINGVWCGRNGKPL